VPPTRMHWLVPLPAMALVAVSAYFLGFLPALGAALTYAVQPRPPRTPASDAHHPSRPRSRPFTRVARRGTPSGGSQP
jgi:hypothetical protein